MLLWQIYRAKTGKQNLDMLLDILPNQDNSFRRSIDIMLCRGTSPWIFSLVLFKAASVEESSRKQQENDTKQESSKHRCTSASPILDLG